MGQKMYFHYDEKNFFGNIDWEHSYQGENERAADVELDMFACGMDRRLWWAWLCSHLL